MRVFISSAVVLLALAGVGYALSAPESKVESRVIGADYAYTSNEGILIRYFAKQELYKDRFADNPHVQRVKNKDGTFNVEAVRSLFIERGIMTGADFDAAYAAIKSGSYVDSTDKATQKGITSYEAAKAVYDTKPALVVDSGSTTTPQE